MQSQIPIYQPPPLPQPQGLINSPGEVYRYYQDYFTNFLSSLTDYMQSVATLANTGSQGFGPDLTSANDVVVSAYQHRVTGTNTIQNLNFPPGLTASHVTLVSQNGFGLTTGGNIAIAKQLRPDQAIMMNYNPVSNMWFPISTIQDLADVPDNPALLRFAVAAIDAIGKALIDFTQTGHLGPTLANFFDASASWASLHAYAIPTFINDSNGNAQQLVVAGTSGNSVPTWSTTVGGVTTDGSAQWTMVGTASWRRLTGVNTGNQATDSSINNVSAVKILLGGLTVAASNGASEILIKGGASVAYLRMQSNDATPAEMRFENTSAVVKSKISGNSAGDLFIIPEVDNASFLQLGITIPSNKRWASIIGRSAGGVTLEGYSAATSVTLGSSLITLSGQRADVVIGGASVGDIVNTGNNAGDFYIRDFDSIRIRGDFAINATVGATLAAWKLRIEDNTGTLLGFIPLYTS